MDRRFPAWALLLSGAAHIGLFAALGGSGSGSALVGGLKPAATVTVQLNASADTTTQADTVPPPPQRPSHAHASTARAAVRPHYFDAAEWTDAPALIQDIAADQLLVSPRLTAQPLRITLFINEQGGVDRVEVGGEPLPAFEKQLVDMAFAVARFQAARAGGLAVRSRLDIELKLENMRADPVPAETSAAMSSS